MTDDISDLYIKNDLGDYAYTDIDDPDGYGRTDYLRAILPNSAEVEVYSTGGYQGTMVFVIRLDDYLWVIKEAYGSCNLCDGFVGRGDGHKIEYAESMCRNAYCFESEDDAIKFLKQKDEDGGYIWEKVANKAIEMLK